MTVAVAADSPTLTFEVDFTNDPSNGTRVYTDITDDVRSLSYTRSGRNSELNRTEPGRLTAVLNNRHAYYDPGNTSSPRYPNVKRMRWCRVSATWAGVTYRRWTGLVETWSQNWPARGKDATVTITATDALKVLNLYDLAGQSFPTQLTSQRVSAVLTAAGITSSTVATGETSIVAAGPFSAGSGGLQHLMQVEETENGLLFAEGDGSVAFQNRNYRNTTAASKVSQGVIGDRPVQDIPYLDARYDLDDAYLWNTAAVTPDAGGEQTATDAASKLTHFERRLTRSILSASATDALNTAQYLVQRYANPSSRAPQVQILGRANPGKWPVILAGKNSDRFTWLRSAQTSISTQVFVERVGDTVVPGQGWVVVWDLSPAIDQVGWVVGDSVNGVVGSTTRAVY